MQKQGMVAGCDLGGSGTDPAAYMGFIQNLLSQEAEALHFLLIDQYLLLPTLIKEALLETFHYTQHLKHHSRLWML